MRRNPAFQVEPHAYGRISDREDAQLQALARRGMKSNADHVNLIRDHIRAHRLAAAESTLPRVRTHLSALADHLEMGLDAEKEPPVTNANVLDLG